MRLLNWSFVLERRLCYNEAWYTETLRTEQRPDVWRGNADTAGASRCHRWRHSAFQRRRHRLMLWMIQLKVSKVVWLAKILKPAYQFWSLKPSIPISRLFSIWYLYRFLIIVNAVVADLNMEKSLLVGTFSKHCEISRKFFDSSSAYCMCNMYSCMCNAQCEAWPQFWQHHIRYIFTPERGPVHLQPAAQLSPICRDSPYMSPQLKCCGSYYRLVYVLRVVVGGRETS